MLIPLKDGNLIESSLIERIMLQYPLTEGDPHLIEIDVKGYENVWCRFATLEEAVAYRAEFGKQVNEANAYPLFVSQPQSYAPIVSGPSFYPKS